MIIDTQYKGYYKIVIEQFNDSVKSNPFNNITNSNSSEQTFKFYKKWQSIYKIFQTDH